MKYNTFCPLFPGFYGTHFEYAGEDSDISYYNQEYGTSLGYDDFKWDYREYEKRVAKAFVERIEKELNEFIKIKIEFQEVRSPREYNFENDSINISVQVSLNKLLQLILARKEQATEYFKETYTDCSGFISSHSPFIEDWLNKDYILEKPEHRIGALLDCLCSIEIDTDSTTYWCDSQTGYIDYTPNDECVAN